MNVLKAEKKLAVISALTEGCSIRSIVRMPGVQLANLKAAVALYFWSYNFCLIHRSLRMTPAMAAGITDRIWELDELV